jgi:Ca2+-transporting ATPase
MTQIVVFNFFHVLNSRSLDQSITKIPFFSNRLLFYTVVGAGAAQMAVLYLPPLQRVFSTVPIPLEMWGMMLLIGSTVIIGGELDKWWNRRRGVLLG